MKTRNSTSRTKTQLKGLKSNQARTVSYLSLAGSFVITALIIYVLILFIGIFTVFDSSAGVAGITPYIVYSVLLIALISALMALLYVFNKTRKYAGI